MRFELFRIPTSFATSLAQYLRSLSWTIFSTKSLIITNTSRETFNHKSRNIFIRYTNITLSFDIDYLAKLYGIIILDTHDCLR